MKNAFIFLSVFIFLSSCVIDFRQDFIVVNCTNDTLYCGVSQYDNVDSVHYPIVPFSDISTGYTDTADVYLWNGLNVRNYAVLPDSLCTNSITTLFERNDTGFIFYIKRQTAKQYSWEDICKKRLYKKISITREDKEKCGTIKLYD